MITNQSGSVMARYKDISVFEGLAPLRFFAAFLVVMHHSEVIKKKHGLYNLEWLALFRNGGNAVTFFFVLSGFLITYLLLKEDKRTGTINISTFYLKRVLRIWPLYYLLIAIGTIVLPFAFHVFAIPYETPYSLNQVWYYFVFFVPGLVTFLYGHHFLEFLWSIGVEEVFYVVWPLLFRFFRRNLLTVLLFTILLKVVLMILAFFFAPDNSIFSYMVYTFSFESIAIGGLGAYFVFNSEKPLSGLFIYKKVPQTIIYSVLVVFLFGLPDTQNAMWRIAFCTPIASSIFIDFLFLYLIAGVSVVDNNIIRLRSKTLSYLGNISYGIYMYHMLVVFAVVQFFKKYLAAMEPMQSTIVYYAILTSGVILLSAISKATFENYFLRLKPKAEGGGRSKHGVSLKKYWQPKPLQVKRTLQ